MKINNFVDFFKNNKKKILYNKISDWNFPLLYELKNNKPVSYVKTVHISHYALNLSSLLKLNDDLVKVGASYSCILSIFENDKDKLYSLTSDLDFPDELISLLKEVNDDITLFSSSEAFIISLCKTFVYALIKLKNNNKNIEALYDNVVNSVLLAYYNSNRLKQLNITFKEFEAIRKDLLEDKKYIKIIND